MYHVLMLHLIGETCCYMGAVSVVLPEEDDDAVSHVEELFDRFRKSDDREAHLFIDWLGEQDEATEVRFDDESPNLPLQVYLKH